MPLAPQLTRIVATVGPSCDTEDALVRLVESGASVFRLNFSHGDLAAHERRLNAVRAAGARLGLPLAVLGDLQGPKIRVGIVAEPGVVLEAGADVVFRRGSFVATGEGPPVAFASTYDRLVDDVEAGQRVLVDDGTIRMLAIASDADELRCTVVTGGRVTSGKGINLPDTALRAGPLSPRDLDCVTWSVEHDLDFLALSFVRTAEEVRELRSLIDRAARAIGLADLRLPIVAKIERPEAVTAIESIVQEADAIMVARGDLGVEMDIAKVPVVQRRLVETAHKWGRPCIVATQMLQSMIEVPMPTRAEVSDVATAIFASTDAVMLSGETAVGKYPALAVETMRRVAQETESYIAEQPPVDRAPTGLATTGYRTAALAHGVAIAARDFRARFLVVWSQSGGGARYLSQNDLRIPIVAVSSDERAVRQMQLLRAVVPVRMPVPDSLARFTEMIDAYLLDTGWAATGDRCVMVAGSPLGTTQSTNALALHEVGNPHTGFR